MTSKQVPNSFTALILDFYHPTWNQSTNFTLFDKYARAHVIFIGLLVTFAWKLILQRSDFYISLIPIFQIFHLIYLSDIFRVFCADHTYTTLALPYKATAQTIVNTAEERVLLGNDCVLCEVKSSGGLFYVKRFLYAFTWQWPICFYFSFLHFISILIVLGQNETSISETICPTVLGFGK